MTKILVLFIIVNLASASISDYFKWGNNSDTNSNEVAPKENYSFYKSLMLKAINGTKSDHSMPEQHEHSNIEESLSQDHPLKNTTVVSPKVVQTVQDAVAVLFEVAVVGIFEGLFPHVERQKREAIDEKKTVIDIVFNFLGALMGRQQCSEILACR